MTRGNEYNRKRLEIEKKMRAMMRSLKKNIPRVTGNKWNIQKFHALLHLGLDIILFGSPLMFDAARPESHHQTVCKEPARKCQKTHKNWTKKVGKKLEEERAWSSFRDMMGLTGEEPETQHTTDSIKNAVQNILYTSTIPLDGRF